jgi:predicted ArsR family transcriptional regulator
MPRERDSESGRFKQVYSDEKLLSLLQDTRLATSEVAEELNCHRTTAHEKLRGLEDDGLVQAHSAGNTLIWESTADGT